jgi:hypothetical protein
MVIKPILFAGTLCTVCKSYSLFSCPPVSSIVGSEIYIAYLYSMQPEDVFLESPIWFCVYVIYYYFFTSI